ncbi:efflux RND transporter permease subunit [uncultured Selenomonas sp.]|uniref:efflux RND transporter permease subunit n=1 Tax=uncultured Selenomonas sp. TaxID=159275 RepID=UPI00262233C7|nr:efflux RND transporter permease subunit [uncultured Selenomonas sp.]
MRNLTEISLKHKGLVWYFILVVFIGGIFSYGKLGRMEDPDFTIRQMVVSVAWPGATAQQMEEQVTDKLEKKLQDVPGLKELKSYSREGQAVIYVTLDDDVAKEDIRPTWRDARNLCEDEKRSLPTGVYGPYYNDRFDDVFGSVYAVTGDGWSYEEMREQAEKTRRALLAVENVQKVELIGVQPEKIYVEAARERLAELGIPPDAILSAIRTQEEMTPAGMIETQTDNVYVRVSGAFDDLEAIRALPIAAGGRTFRLGDVASVTRRYAEPAEPKMYFNGEPAVGIAVSMRPGGNILTLGKDLQKKIAALKDDLPLGLEIHQVSDQPQVVAESIDDFVDTLREAVIIVLAVSFLTLGLRTGFVVACCIPLVLTGVFLFMYGAGIDLQKVSLGALIISLGLLVDDEIIAVEMMSVKLEEGLDRFSAASHAFRATALPMLTGTLITCAGFIPVAFSKGMAAEFCASLFPVIAAALLLSWIVSVMVAPLLGYHIIRIEPKRDEKGEALLHQGRFYRAFRRVLEAFLVHRRLVLGATALVFAGSIALLGVCRQDFFPPSLRPEIIVEMHLAEGSSMKNTDGEAKRFAAFLDGLADEYRNYSVYVGEGAPRFVLTFEPVLAADNYAQFVIVANDKESREDLTAKIRTELSENFPNVRANLKFIQTGPPAAYPVMLRVEGEDKEKVMSLANEVADLVASDANTRDVNLDWQEKSKVLHLALDQDKLKALGLSTQMVQQMLYTELAGVKAAELYEGDRTVDIVLRLREEARDDLSRLEELPIYLPQTGYVPLAQVAKISYDAENGIIWRRDLKPAVTVRADIIAGTPTDAAKKAYAATKELRESLPAGYAIEPDGSLADSEDSMRYLLAPVPAMIFLIMTLLIFQVREGRAMLITLLTAPLGVIGVACGMFLTGEPIGFVADLGILALSGMIIRNSVILIDQIQKHIEAGEAPWQAVIDSAVLRFRPIMLTAAAAILGMIPLMTSSFWGPMAVAIASGLLVATVLTLLVLPVMYVVVYRVKRET